MSLSRMVFHRVADVARRLASSWGPRRVEEMEPSLQLARIPPSTAFEVADVRESRAWRTRWTA